MPRYEFEIDDYRGSRYKVIQEAIDASAARKILVRREGVSEAQIYLVGQIWDDSIFHSDTAPSPSPSPSRSNSYSPSADSGGCLIVVLGLVFASLFSFFNGEEVGEPQRIENSRPVPQPERVEDSRPTVESRRAEDSRLIFEPLADIYEDAPATTPSLADIYEDAPATTPSLDVIPDEPKPKESDCNMWARSGRRC